MNHQDGSRPGKAKWTRILMHKLRAWVHQDPNASSESCVSLGGVDYMTQELNRIYRSGVLHLVRSLGDNQSDGEINHSDSIMSRDF